MRRYIKNILCYSALSFFGFVQAQDIVRPKPAKNVPIAVSAAFNEKFTNKEPVWFTQYQGRYDQKLVFEGRFIFDNRYSAAVYNSDGNFLAFAATVDTKEIPAKAIGYMKENYPNFPINDAMLVTRGENQVTYEIGIYIENQYVIQVFSKEGDFIKSTKS